MSATHGDEHTRSHNKHGEILKLSVTLCDIHTCALTRTRALSPPVALSSFGADSFVFIGVHERERAEQKRMKNEPNNVGAKVAPIKRIDGSKVCKDGAEVFTTAAGHKIFTGGIFTGGGGGHDVQVLHKNACKCSEDDFWSAFIHIQSRVSHTGCIRV